jgi:hypothetical protein
MFRRGADQVKVMANGGCISPADELTSIQFTVALPSCWASTLSQWMRRYGF